MALFCCEALVYDRTYQTHGIKYFGMETGKNVSRCGLSVDKDRPYLVTLLNDLVETIIDKKCAFAGRNKKIHPGKFFPILTVESMTKEYRF